ncbi:MAG: sorbosone dehydrogenase family protein [Xanthobacteraceae bacterium]
MHAASAQPSTGDGGELRSGRAAFGDWREDAPGVRRLIEPGDLPPPGRSTSASARVVARPSGAALKVPPGFKVEQFAGDLSDPRQIRVAPNGDVFIAESSAGRIRVLRPNAQGTAPSETAVFASGLDYPFGIAFYPPGDSPEWIYVGNTDSVVRFPYRNGDFKARGKPETIVAKLPTGGHATRDVVFSPDGARMFVSVGSLSNVSQGGGKLGDLALRQWEAEHGTGATWGSEADRATVLVFDPSGKDQRHFANGVRNCVGMAIHPATDDLWCATNERDGIGDDLPPDYVTRVRDGAFYGWPWYYIGANEDPRHKGARPDLKDKVVIPDVLIQAHSAALGMDFYTADQFPAEYRGNAFVGLHGSWNRAKRTGYKIVRIPTQDGVPTGEYVDFVTGFVTDDGRVWGRPVGVAVAKDGSLLFTEDGNDTVWRVTYAGSTPQQ